MIRKKSNQNHYDESPVNSTARLLTQAFDKAGVRPRVSLETCENLSSFLNRAYSTRSQAFHNISHAHDVAHVTSGSATAQLAALFHDVVYFQIDWGRRAEIKKLFSPFEVIDGHRLIVPPVNDEWANALITIFGFTEHQVIYSLSGLNEFLSAWIAIQKLKPFLSATDLLKVAACIQATIPLWTNHLEYSKVPEALHDGLKAAASGLKLRLSESFFEKAVSEAVEMANLDVMSFAFENPRNFLYNSWALVGESNPALQGSLFTVSQYREAIAKMEQFFSNLKPDSIFREYHKLPKPLEMMRLRKSSERNLIIGSHYILLRLIDTCLIESIAVLTGGDAPLEMFIGPKTTRRERNPARLDLFLDYKIPKCKNAKRSPIVLQLLSEKSAFRSAFDSKGAPLAAYLYERMSAEECLQAIAAVKKYIAREISPSDYLASLKPELVISTIDAVTHIAFTREEGLKRLRKVFKTLKIKIA